jgi:DNA-binding PucR family transcriptional regulator
VRLMEPTLDRATTTAGPGAADGYRTLLAGLPPEQLREYHERLLGPLRAYDAAHRSKLLLTLRSFLAHSGSWSAAAQELHLHVNTLRYRIGRIQQLTGRDPSRLEDQADLLLAVEAARMSARPTDPSWPDAGQK